MADEEATASQGAPNRRVVLAAAGAAALVAVAPRTATASAVTAMPPTASSGASEPEVVFVDRHGLYDMRHTMFCDGPLLG